MSAAARGGGAVAVAVLFSGCGGGPGPVAVSDSSLQTAAATQCSRLIDALPDRVAGQTRRDVSPPGAPAAAWGEPALVLRCGVSRPTALRRTSDCLQVDHIGWLATHAGKAVPINESVDGLLVFTTIGRSVYVEVSVPADYQPAADALVDVARSVRTTTSVLHRCR